MKKKSRTNTSKNYLPTVFKGLFVLLSLGLVYGCWLLIAQVVSIKTIQCQMTTSTPCSHELHAALTPLVGQSMFFINIPQELKEAHTVSLPVSIVDIEKKFPNTVSVVFQPEPARYIIRSGDQVVLVSFSGKVFSEVVPSTGLITIEADQSLTSPDGTVPADMHQTILNILDTAVELQLPLEKIRWVDKSTIQLSMKERAELFILDSVSPKLQLHKLSLVLKSSEYRDLTETKQELDLRFNMPVLRTQP